MSPYVHNHSHLEPTIHPPTHTFATVLLATHCPTDCQPSSQPSHTSSTVDRPLSTVHIPPSHTPSTNPPWQLLLLHRCVCQTRTPPHPLPHPPSPPRRPLQRLHQRKAWIPTPTPCLRSCLVQAGLAALYPWPCCQNLLLVCGCCQSALAAPLLQTHEVGAGEYAAARPLLERNLS